MTLPAVFPEAYALRCLHPKEGGYYDERVLKILRKMGYRRTAAKKYEASVFFPLLYMGEPEICPPMSSAESRALVAELAGLVGAEPDPEYLKLF